MSKCTEEATLQRDPTSRLRRRAKERAAALGLPYALTRADVIIPSYCPVLGIPLNRNAGGRSGSDNSPSLERLIPERGYVPGNVVVISNRANRIRNNASADELFAIARWLKRMMENLNADVTEGSRAAATVVQGSVP